MAASKITNTHPQSQGYPPGVLISPPSNVGPILCTLCARLLRQPRQNDCGHRFCECCMASLCQGCQQELCRACLQEGAEADRSARIDYESSTEDKGIARDMATLAARCLNCSWRGTLAEYMTHENSCESDEGSESGLEDFELMDLHDNEPQTEEKKGLNNRTEVDWRISDVAKKLEQAQYGTGNVVYSEPFYTQDGSYKLGACVYLNGDGMARGKYMSAFIVIYRGDNDNSVAWPFNKKITITLVNQTGQNHVAQAFRPDPTSSSFKRPTEEKNTPSGISIFCPLSAIRDQNSGLVVNDIMQLKVIFD